VLLWATQGALIGYLGGRLFADKPALALAIAWGGAALLTGCAIATQRLIESIRSARVAGRRAPAEDMSHADQTRCLVGFSGFSALSAPGAGNE
jgi:hypothetical protein